MMPLLAQRPSSRASDAPAFMVPRPGDRPRIHRRPARPRTAGVLIDWLTAHHYSSPYTIVIFGSKAVGLLALPFFVVAGLRFDQDRERLLAQEGEPGMAPEEEAAAEEGKSA